MSTSNGTQKVSSGGGFHYKSSPWFFTRFFNALSKASEDQSYQLLNSTLSRPSKNITSNSSLPIQKQQQPSNQQDEQLSVAALHFNYFIGPYAAVCMIMAIVLNSTVTFASTSGLRRNNQNNTQRQKRLNILKVSLRLLSIGILLRSLWSVILQYGFIFPQFKLFLTQNLLTTFPKTTKLSSLLWDIFLTLCSSQFVETFVSVTSGQLPSNGTGLTLFEHSLAFQEAHFYKRPSLPLLVILTFSLVNQIVTQLIGLLSWKRYQLIPSTVMGVSFLIFYCVSAYTDDLFLFPTIVIFSVIPQILVISIVSFCLFIYFAAVVFNGGDTSNLTYTPMILNLRNSLNVQLNDDFNSVLMRFGSIMLTAVDNEEYVNELSNLSMPKRTYIDILKESRHKGKAHLLSGYFNKNENNPELVEDEDEDDISKDNTTNTNDGFLNRWTLAKKYFSLFKLFMGLFKILKISFKRIKKGKQLPDTASQENIRILDFSQSPPLREVSSQEYELLINDEVDEFEFQYESESDLDPLEFDSEYEDPELINEYTPTLAAARSNEYQPAQRQTKNPSEKPSVIDELFSAKDTLSLIRPTDEDEISFLASLKTHLIKDERITRSSYAKINQDDLLEEVILRCRRDSQVDKIDHDHDHHDEDQVELECVVCQTNQRTIILWPCKCFALCEGCRISLGVRGFGICVCCRQKVEGYSKVYIP